MDLLTPDMLQRYLLATAVTFGLLALLGWLAARLGPGAGVQLGHSLGQRIKGTPTTSAPAPRPSLFNLFRTNSGTGKQLKRLETLPLTPHHQLHKVQDGLRTYLFTTHPGGITLLSSTIESKGLHDGGYDTEEPAINYAAPRPNVQTSQLVPQPVSSADPMPESMILARSKPRRS